VLGGTVAAAGDETFTGTATVAVLGPTVLGFESIGGTCAVAVSGPAVAAVGVGGVEADAVGPLLPPRPRGRRVGSRTGRVKVAIAGPTVKATGWVACPVTGTAAVAVAGPTVDANGQQAHDGQVAAEHEPPEVEATGFVAYVVSAKAGHPQRRLTGGAAVALTAEVEAQGSVVNPPDPIDRAWRTLQQQDEDEAEMLLLGLDS